MHKMQFRIIFLLLVLVTNAKITKINTSFLTYFSLVKGILKYYSYFGYSFSMLLKLILTLRYNFDFNF